MASGVGVQVGGESGAGLDDSSRSAGRWGLEWWYVAHLTFGMVYLGIVPVLVPAYVISVTNSASAAGVVMAILGLGALMAPAIGSFADRYRAHRAVQLAGLAAMGVGAAIFAGAKEDLVFAAAAVVMGFGVATMLMVNPTFIVAAGFSAEDESTHLARLFQVAIVGQLIGSLLIATLAEAEWSFEDRFWVAAGLATAGLVVTGLTNKAAAARINVEPAAVAEEAGTEASGPGIWKIMASAFGLFVLANFLNSIGHAATASQYPNFMQRVFDIGQAASAAALSVGAVVTFVALGVGGWWLAKSGAARVFQWSLALRLAAAAGLVLLVGSKPAMVLPLGLWILFQVGIQFVDMANPPIAARISPTTTGAAQGFVMGALALGTFCGGLLGGWAAEAFGFDWLPVITSAGIGLALVVSLFALRGYPHPSRTVEGPTEAAASS